MFDRNVLVMALVIGLCGVGFVVLGVWCAVKLLGYFGVI